LIKEKRPVVTDVSAQLSVPFPRDKQSNLGSLI